MVFFCLLVVRIIRIYFIIFIRLLYLYNYNYIYTAPSHEVGYIKIIYKVNNKV